MSADLTGLLPSVTFELPRPSETIIVLSQSDDRYYHDLSSSTSWTFDFKLFKRGEDVPLASSTFSYSLHRSGSLRVQLDPGEYVVHIRLNSDVDQEKVSDAFNKA